MKLFATGYVGIYAMLLGVCMPASVALAQYGPDPFGSDDPATAAAAKKIELAQPHAVLLEDAKPGEADVRDLVRSLGNCGAAVRQAAIRRLLQHPDVAEAGVVRAFRDGTLATRLAALELLDEWEAPIAGLDPWQVETITDARLAKLDQWLKQQPARLAKKAEEPSAEQSAAEEELFTERLADAKRQIARMLQSSDEEAAAIRERLARLATILLPEVREQLSGAETDRRRHLLLALRYRLIASDALALKWPQGLVRLAASDAKKRLQAAEELARLATTEDQSLLLELFSDPDPLVREISLRGLRQLGGEDATAALVRLLKDPEPNVRAAVLKQLAEDPPKEMLEKVAQYVKNEKDADLVVHAIRFLRSGKGPVVIKSLMSLLKHESWQVRAEAAEGIGKAINSSIPDSFKADAYVALIGLLDDEDAFVVSRAVDGLADSDMEVAVKPLAVAAEKHPDLATHIIRVMANNSNMRKKALPYLQKFRKHENPSIRAAAIAGLSDGGLIGAELTVALEDPAAEVRITTAGIIFNRLELYRGTSARQLRNPDQNHSGVFLSDAGEAVFGVDPPGSFVQPAESLTAKAIKMLFGSKKKDPQEEEIIVEEPVEAKAVEPVQVAETVAVPQHTEPEAETPRQNKWDQWLVAFHNGKGRAKWQEDMVAPLTTMLGAKDQTERILAAKILVSLGKNETAMPVLREISTADPTLRGHAVAVLPWLVWEKRLDLFSFLLKSIGEKGDFGSLVESMTEVPDRRAAEHFWKLLAAEGIKLDRAVVLRGGLVKTYFGDDYYSLSEVDHRTRLDLATMAQPRAEAGSELQRLISLTLLAVARPEKAVEVAGKMLVDETMSEKLRNDAFQVLLLTREQKAAVGTAVAGMATDNEQRRRMSLLFLVNGTSSVRLFRESFYIRADNENYDPFDNNRGGTPIIPGPPPGLKAEHVRPLIDDADPNMAALAGYLLAMFAEADGIDPLLKLWREKKDVSQVNKLVYRAIAVLDDPAHIPVLKEIYAGLGSYEKSDFYWTIRIMSGPEILKFRKQIRDEVGMSNLR